MGLLRATGALGRLIPISGIPMPMPMPMSATPTERPDEDCTEEGEVEVGEVGEEEVEGADSAGTERIAPLGTATGAGALGTVGKTRGTRLTSFGFGEGFGGDASGCGDSGTPTPLSPLSPVSTSILQSPFSSAPPCTLSAVISAVGCALAPSGTVRTSTVRTSVVRTVFSAIPTSTLALLRGLSAADAFCASLHNKESSLHFVTMRFTCLCKLATSAAASAAPSYFSNLLSVLAMPTSLITFSLKGNRRHTFTNVVSSNTDSSCTADSIQFFSTRMPPMPLKSARHWSVSLEAITCMHRERCSIFSTRVMKTTNCSSLLGAPILPSPSSMPSNVTSSLSSSLPCFFSSSGRCLSSSNLDTFRVPSSTMGAVWDWYSVRLFDCASNTDLCSRKTSFKLSSVEVFASLDMVES
mmetsp:Transcript_23710/g.52689  ORF Transcript_23710/g.52689 Transcript_23710/m.52689 type:complete len:411 (+) Transcript_23710:958-2190(+)